MDTSVESAVKSWLEGPYDQATKDEILHLQKEHPDQLVDAFYKRLSFGTGGLRGLMGVGTNRLNIYTIRAAGQGLATYILKINIENPSIIIGYDSRHNSRLFAEETAKVMAANGIKTYLYASLRPVPMVSFGCRYKKTSAGVMITASHNPAIYNGYKVYWNDGGQVVYPHDEGIIHEVSLIQLPTQVKQTSSLNSPLIEEIHEEIDKAYLETISSLALWPEVNHKEGHQLKIVYTSLYGTGITMVPKALVSWGFSNLHFVQEQIVPNGDFPTTPHPNPEEKAALALGIEKLKLLNADILIGTDPDCDRMGIVAKDIGEPVIFNGNEIVCLCLNHILEGLTKQGRLSPKAAFIKTIVTSELFTAIANSYKRPCFNVLTGFKYIGQLMTEWENNNHPYEYIYGGEESYGSLFGTHARDKDAIIASTLIAEVALQAKLQNITLQKKLYSIYQKEGVFRERLDSLVYEGKKGADQIIVFMEKLRTNPPTSFNQTTVIKIDDYQKRVSLDTQTKKEMPILLPISNVLVFWLADNSRLVIRPSGTEPKIKLYAEVREKGDVEISILKADKRLNAYIESLKALLQ